MPSQQCLSLALVSYEWSAAIVVGKMAGRMVVLWRLRAGPVGGSWCLLTLRLDPCRHHAPWCQWEFCPWPNQNLAPSGFCEL